MKGSLQIRPTPPWWLVTVASADPVLMTGERLNQLAGMVGFLAGLMVQRNTAAGASQFRSRGKALASFPGMAAAVWCGEEVPPSMV